MCATSPEHADDSACLPIHRWPIVPLAAKTPEALDRDGGWRGPLGWFRRSWWASAPPDGAAQARTILAEAAHRGRRLRVGLFGTNATDLAAAVRAISATFPLAAIAAVVVAAGGSDNAGDLSLQSEILGLSAPDVVFAALPLQVFRESLRSCSPAAPRAAWIRTGDSFEGAFAQAAPRDDAACPSQVDHEPTFHAGSTGAGEPPAIREPEGGPPYPPAAGHPRQGAGQ